MNGFVDVFFDFFTLNPLREIPTGTAPYWGINSDARAYYYVRWRGREDINWHEDGGVSVVVCVCSGGIHLVCYVGEMIVCSRQGWLVSNEEYITRNMSRSMERPLLMY